MVVGSGTGKANTPIVGKPKMHENMAEMAKKDYYIAKGSRDRAQGGTTGTVTDSAWKQRKARQKQAAHTAARRIICLEDFIIKKGFTLPAIEVDDCGGDLQRDPHERHKCHFYPSKMGKNQEVPVVTLKQVISRMDSDTERRDLLGRQVAELQQGVEDMSHGLQKALWTARLQNGKLERLITEQAQTNSEKQGGDNKTNDYKTSDSEGTQQEHVYKDRAKQPWTPEYTQELFTSEQGQGGSQQGGRDRQDGQGAGCHGQDKGAQAAGQDLGGASTAEYFNIAEESEQEEQDEDAVLLRRVEAYIDRLGLKEYTRVCRGGAKWLSDLRAAPAAIRRYIINSPDYGDRAYFSGRISRWVFYRNRCENEELAMESYFEEMTDYE